MWLPPGLQTYFTILWMYAAQNGVDLAEASIFYERSNRSADKDKNSSTFVYYHARLIFRLFVAFMLLWAYPVKK